MRETRAISEFRIQILILAGALTLLPACRITFVPEDGVNGNRNSGSGRLPLNQVRAQITITQRGSDPDVSVNAELTDNRGRAVNLGGDQSIELNGRVLGSAGAGRLTARIPVATNYEFTVREPTRGVERTTAAGPAEFSIVSPPEGEAGPLSGFSLTWSNVNPAARIQVVVDQFVFGELEQRIFSEPQDDGAFFFSLEDLTPFVQGAALDIDVIKSLCTSNIAGLASATVCVERGASRSVNPAP